MVLGPSSSLEPMRSREVDGASKAWGWGPKPQSKFEGQPRWPPNYVVALTGASQAGFQIVVAVKRRCAIEQGGQTAVGPRAH